MLDFFSYGPKGFERCKTWVSVLSESLVLVLFGPGYGPKQFHLELMERDL